MPFQEAGTCTACGKPLQRKFGMKWKSNPFGNCNNCYGHYARLPLWRQRLADILGGHPEKIEALPFREERERELMMERFASGLVPVAIIETRHPDRWGVGVKVGYSARAIESLERHVLNMLEAVLSIEVPLSQEDKDTLERLARRKQVTLDECVAEILHQAAATDRHRQQVQDIESGEAALNK